MHQTQHKGLVYLFAVTSVIARVPRVLSVPSDGGECVWWSGCHHRQPLCGHPVLSVIQGHHFTGLIVTTGPAPTVRTNTGGGEEIDLFTEL